MKGIVFTVLQRMIEEQFGLAVWDKIVTEGSLDSQGIYTASATYKDEEALAIVGGLARHSGVAPDALVRAFGSFLLKTLAVKYPKFFADMTLKPFLISVDRVIHIEVRKLYPGAELPEFKYEDPGDCRLIMIYRSRRKLCSLAEGLIQGASEHFREPVVIKHAECMKSGADHCRLELTIATKSEGKKA